MMIDLDHGHFGKLVMEVADPEAVVKFIDEAKTS